MKWPTSSLRKRRPRPRKNRPSAKGFRGRWSAEIQPLEDRALLSAGQDLVNQLKPYQTALTTAINAATSLPLIGNQFKSVQQFNTILQDSLASIESQTQNLTSGHYQLAVPLPAIAQTFQFDLGLNSFLQFSTSGGVAVTFNPVLNIGFDYQNGSATLNASQTNLDLGLNVSLPNFTATLTFNSLLYANAVDEGTNFSMHLGFGFDTDGSIDPHFSGDANVLLGLTLSFVNPALNAPFNPEFKTDFDMDWSIDTQSNQMEAPTIKLKNFSLDVSSFVHGFLGDVLSTVQKYTKPLEPFIDVFDKPVPILSAFDGNETIGDLLLQGAGFSQDQQDRFELMVSVIKAVNTIDLSGSTDSGLLNFGDISLTGDARNAGGFNFDASQLQGVVGQIFGNSALKDIQDTLQSVASYTGLESTGGMQFPLLDDPGPVIVGLLTGQTKDMFTFSTGRQHFELAPSVGFGIPDVLGVFLSAGIVFDADLTMGYDTAGLIKFVQDPDKNPEDLLHGFYFDNGIDTTDPPVPDVPDPRNTAIYLHGFAELEISFGPTVTGGLYGDLSFELADPNPGAASSHVYLDDMISNLASGGQVLKASGELYADASISITIPDPIGPDITLFKYHIAHYDILNENPPPPPNLGLPVVVIDSTTLHTIALDPTKMTPGSTVTVEPFSGFTEGGDVDDGIRVDYPGEIDLYVERKDGANSDYYNFVGINGTVPDGVSINVSDPFRVFADAGAPNPAPAQTKPGVLLAGGTDVSYLYDEDSDGSHPTVLLAGGYGYSTLIGGTMEFGNFIPSDRINQAESHFGDTSGYDSVAQGLINSEIQAAVAPADPTGITGSTMTASHGGLMLGGPGDNSFGAAGPGDYDMIGGPWINTFTISPSFNGVPATYTIDGGGGKSLLNVQVPAGELADFEDGTDPDKYNPQSVVLDIYSNAGLFATADGISTVSAFAQPGSSVEVGDTSELNIDFKLAGSGSFVFGGSAGPDQFSVSASYVYYGTAQRHDTPDLQLDGNGNIIPIPTGQDVGYVDPPVFTINRTFGTNGRFQSIQLDAVDPLHTPITLDGRGGSDTYDVDLGLGNFSDINIKDSDATTRNSLLITPVTTDVLFHRATVTDDAIQFEYYTPLEYNIIPEPPNSYLTYYNASVGYYPTVTFSGNVDPTLAGAGLFNQVIIDRSGADPSQTVTVELDGGVGGGTNYLDIPYAYDPEQPNPQLIPLQPGHPEFDVAANSGTLDFSEDDTYAFVSTFNVDANSGDLSFSMSHGWDGLADTINILSNDGTITDTDDLNVALALNGGPDTILNISANTGSISTQTTNILDPQTAEHGIDTQVNIGLGSLDNVHGTINLSNTNGSYGLSIDDSAGTSSGRSSSIDDSATIVGDLTINYAGVNAPAYADIGATYSASLRPTVNPIDIGINDPPFLLKYLDGGSFSAWLVFSGETVYHDGDSVSEQVQLFNSPSSTITYSATGLPPGVSIEPATGHMSGTIPLQSSRPDNDPYVSIVSATANGITRSATFGWFIESLITINSPFAAQTQGYEGQGLDGSIAATSKLNGPISLSVTGLPSGLSFDANSGTITGTIAIGAAQNGPYQVDIHATNGQETADSVFELNVTGITYTGSTVEVADVGDSIDLQVSASTASGAPLTFAAESLPDGLSINPATGVISGTISALAGTTRTYYSTITLTDRNDVQQVLVQWTILPTGAADYISVTAFGTITNQDGDGIYIQPIAYDTLGLPINYTITGLPPGLSLSDGVISGTIAANADTASPYHVQVTATDGRWSADESFDWDVVPASTVALEYPGNQVSDLDLPQNNYLFATSSLNEPITYSATGLPPGLSVDPQTGEITGTIPLQAASPSIFQVAATATAASGSDTKTFLWYVYSNADSNVVTLPSPEGGSPITITSPDGTTLSASISPHSDPAPPAGIDFPFGFLSFEVINTGNTGGPVSLTISGLDVSQITDYYKYGPTPADPSNHWYDFLLNQPTDSDSAAGTGMEIVNGNLVLNLVDGGRGDDDVAANGYVFDIGGPAEGSATGSPATPTVVVSDAGGTYTGHPLAATATATDSDDNTVNGTFTYTYYVGSAASGQGSPTAPTSAGTYTVVSHFASSDPNFTDTDSQPLTFVIGDATPLVTLSDIGGTYQGSPYPATAAIAGVVKGEDDTPGSSLESVPLTLSYYAGSTAIGTPLSGAPTTAGTYTVVESFAGSQDYISVNNSTTFTIGQAAPTLTVADAGGTYNGNPFLATDSVAGLGGSAGSTLEGVALTLAYYTGIAATGSPLSGAPSSAGTYTVVAGFAGSQDYGSASNSATFTIGQAAPTVTVTDAGGMLDGSPFPATATIAGVVSGVDNTPGSSLEGVPLVLTYYVGTNTTGTALSDAPTSAGSYTVVASFAGSLEYETLSNQTSFVISQATPSIVASDAGGTYDGNPFSASATASGVGNASVSGTFGFTYYVGGTASGQGSSTAPTNAATYTVVAEFTSTDPNYLSTDSAPVTFAISPATPTVVASDAGGTYNASPFAASASATGLSDVAVSGSFAFTYYAGGSASGQGSSTAPTNAGTYTVVAAFTSTDSNYAAGPTDCAPVTFTISPATPEVTASDAGGPENGSSYPASATATGVGGATVSGSFAFTYYVGSTASGNGSSPAPSSAGTYTVVADFASTNPNYVTGPTDSAPVTFTIGQATPTVTATDAGGTYDGNPFVASGTATGVGGVTVSGSFAFTYYVGGSASGQGSSTAPTNAGTYAVVAAFTSSNSNYVNGPTVSAPVTFTIGQATPTVVATDAGGTYNGNLFAASGTATGVGGGTVNGSFVYSYYVGSTATGTATATPPTSAGTYTVVAAFTSSDSNYVTGPTDSAPLTFTIGQATPKVVATDAGGTYNGNPFPATATATGVGGAAVSGTFAFTYYVGTSASGSGSSTPPTSVGTYTAVAAFTSTNSNYVTGPTGSTPVTFTISAAAGPTITAPATGSVNENASLVFSTAGGNAISVTDPKAGSGTEQLTLTATHGTLTLATTKGVTSTSASSSASSPTITLKGKLANLNAALNGLKFTPTPGYAGPAALAISYKDSQNSQTASATVAITVVVPASQPTVTIKTFIPLAVPGEPVPLLLEVSDTNASAQAAAFTFAVSFGDGHSTTFSSKSPVLVNHVYTKTGTFTVTVTATDEYGHASAAAIAKIEVASVAVETDPFNSSQTALFVGTSGTETIGFTPSGKSGVSVTLGGTNEGVFTTSGPLIVFGQGGKDTVRESGLKNPLYVLESPTADNVESDLDQEAIKWAGLKAAVEILNA
jgi:Putative Ig domain/PKD domain